MAAPQSLHHSHWPVLVISQSGVVNISTCATAAWHAHLLQALLVQQVVGCCAASVMVGMHAQAKPAGEYTAFIAGLAVATPAVPRTDGQQQNITQTPEELVSAVTQQQAPPSTVQPLSVASLMSRMQRLKSRKA